MGQAVHHESEPDIGKICRVNFADGQHCVRSVTAKQSGIYAGEDGMLRAVTVRQHLSGARRNVTVRRN